MSLSNACDDFVPCQYSIILAMLSDIALDAYDIDTVASQAKNAGATNGQARWPKKSAQFVLNLLSNAEANAKVSHALSRIMHRSRIGRPVCIDTKAFI